MPSFQNTSLPRKKAGSGALAVKEMGGELNAQCPKPIPFSSHIWRMVGCAAALAIAFALYARSEKKIDRSHELRHRSFLLADELRQSSDDLTRMVRTYVITGDPIHKQHYQDILDIRDGKKPRPEAYARIYWDLVLKGGQTPRPDSKQSIPLLELMRQAGFTEEEFQRLGKAKANSDGLTILEFEAMKLVGSGGPEAEANRAKASRMLHDANYHQAKAAIMKPIDEFDVLMDERTLAAVQAAGKTSTIFRYVFVAFGLGLMFALWRLYAALSDTLGGSVDEVYAQIARIGSGDFSATIRVKAGRQNSVLAWLSEMQAKLNRSTQESKQAEAARDRLAIIIESTTDLVGVTDAAGNHLYLNRAGRNLLGVGLDEDITKTNSADFVPSPASHRSVTEGIPTAARLGIWSGEIVLLNRSGQEFPVSQVILAHKTAQGEVESFSTIMRDITARKRAEQRIADELNYSHTMLEASPLGIITYTAEGDAVSVNPAAAQVVGATVPQLGAQNFRSLESWKRSGMFEAADHALKTSQPQDLEAHFVTSFGKSVWLSCRFVPFRHKDRGHLLCLFSEITERKQAEAALEKAHRELVAASRQAGMAEAATGVLHNVGNVLNSVNVASSCMVDSLKKSKAVNLSKVVALLREHETDLGAFLTIDPKGRQILGYLAQLSEHLAGEQAVALKELAQLQKNIEHIKEVVTEQQRCAKGAGKSETLQVRDLVEDTLRMDSGGQSSRDIQVITEFEAAPAITVMKHKVMQILMNLVRNAKQSCHEAGRADQRLTLRVTNGDDRVRIAVSDNGVGISPENMVHIFTHGFTTKKDGHGFGLHSGALAAREMGGRLNVQSDGPGRGATFTLELPL